MDKNMDDRSSNSDQAMSDKEQFKGKRRHGEILENAILQATWDELNEAGYNCLTMEGVATRAKTNKKVVYHRWANKPSLVLAALRKFVLPLYPREEPNTGSLRDDVYEFLNGIAKPLKAIGSETIHGLMVANFGDFLVSSMPQIIRRGVDSTSAMIAIMKSAEARGEINLEKISPQVVSLPADLLRFELLVSREPINDKAISTIVDDIFMPLIHAYSMGLT